MSRRSGYRFADKDMRQSSWSLPLVPPAILAPWRKFKRAAVGEARVAEVAGGDGPIGGIEGAVEEAQVGPGAVDGEEAVEAAGYSAACTTEIRPARPGDDPFRIPRIEVEGADSALRFLRRLLLPGE